MNLSALLLIASFLILLLSIAKLISLWIIRLVDHRPLPLIGGVEKTLWRVAGVKNQPMSWQHYLISILLFNALGMLVLFVLLILQGHLPLNPEHRAGLPWDLALNVAISFVTNTNWQAYAGETTLSYFSQMAGLTVQNFLSAATGIAVAFTLIRALSHQTIHALGNAWQDLTRITLWLLLPASLLLALIFIQQGTIQNFSSSLAMTSLEGVKQWLPGGPVASQEAIKLLGTNGGGFFNANSAHPFENPTALTNFIQMLTILLIPAALCFTFGRLAGDVRYGHTLLWSMSLIFVLCVVVVILAETRGDPLFMASGADSQINMEGKESRFGILNSSLYTVVTTAASAGAVNAMFDSLTPLGGMIPMWLIQSGEVIFGGAGSGLCGILLFMLLAIFIAGLMTGRTPHYLGKKIDVYDMKLIAMAILVTPALTLISTALALTLPAGQAAMLNPGTHGFSEVLYAFSSASGNNGSAFAGLNATGTFWHLLTGICMLGGRFLMLAAFIAIAGSLAAKKRQIVSAASLPGHGPVMVILLTGTVFLAGALTFVPALALGPVAEFLAP